MNQNDSHFDVGSSYQWNIPSTTQYKSISSCVCSNMFILSGFKWMLKLNLFKLKSYPNKCHLDLILMSIPTEIYRVVTNFSILLCDTNKIINTTARHKAEFCVKRMYKTLIFNKDKLKKITNPQFNITIDVLKVYKKKGKYSESIPYENYKNMLKSSIPVNTYSYHFKFELNENNIGSLQLKNNNNIKMYSDLF
eukprot:246193_1